MQENYRNSKVIQRPLNFKHYKYVLENCRVADRIEMMLTGYTKNKVLEKYVEMEDGVIGSHQGIPFVASGTHVIKNEVWYWFFATPIVKDFFIKITHEANKLINKTFKKHPDKKHYVQVWSKHTDSIEWLNTLKFQQFGSYFVGNEQILLVERKGN